MGRLNSFNREELITSDVDFIQDTKTEELKNWFKDQVLTPGILVPSSATSAEINSLCPAVFPLTINAGTLTVGPTGTVPVDSIHVAYDEDGNRTAFPDLDQTPFNKNAYTFSTTGITGTPITPFSTGRLGIDLRAPSTGTATRYIFISHISVVKTVSVLTGTPPNHNTTTGTVITPNADTKKAIGNLDQLTGYAYAHQHIDGYRIFVATGADDPDYSGTPEVTISGSSITLNATNIIANGYVSAYADADKAIYLGKFVITDAAVLVGSVDYTERSLFRLRPIESTTIDSANRPASYAADGTQKTVSEHMNSVGTGTVTPENAHGITYVDLGPLPLGANHAVSNGLVDYSDTYRTRSHPSNSPMVDSENESGAGILHAWIDNANSSIPSADYVVAQVAGSPPAVSFSTIAASGFTNGVYLTPLAPHQTIILDGFESTTIAPMVDYRGISTPFVSFRTGEAAGEWTIFATLYNGVATLGKTQSATLPSNCLPLSKVNWELIGLSYVVTPAFTDKSDGSAFTWPQKMLATDLRSAGGISTEQISTDAINHPTKGLLTQQNLNNKIGNGDAAWGLSDWANTTYSIDPVTNVGSPSSGTIGAVTLTAMTASTIPAGLNATTTGPKKGTAIKAALVPSSSGINKSVGINIASLKPDTNYNVEMWIAASGADNTGLGPDNTIRISTRFTNSSGQTSLCVASKDSGVGYIQWPYDISFTRDGAFHKAVVPLKTLSGGSPSVATSTDKLTINFYKASGMSGNCEVYITDLIVTEGEWTHANIPTIPPTVIKGSLSAGTSGGNCPVTLTTPLVYSPAVYDVSKTLFKFDDGGGAGTNPSIVSKGQICTILCNIPHATFMKWQNYWGSAAGAPHGIFASMYVDGALVQYAKSVVLEWAQPPSAANNYLRKDTLPLKWSGYLSPGPHTVYVYVVGSQLMEYYGSAVFYNYVREYLTVDGTDPKIEVILE